MTASDKGYTQAYNYIRVKRGENSNVKAFSELFFMEGESRKQEYTRPSTQARFMDGWRAAWEEVYGEEERKQQEREARIRELAKNADADKGNDYTVIFADNNGETKRGKFAGIDKYDQGIRVLVYRQTETDMLGIFWKNVKTINPSVLTPVVSRFDIPGYFPEPAQQEAPATPEQAEEPAPMEDDFTPEETEEIRKAEEKAGKDTAAWERRFENGGMSDNQLFQEDMAHAQLNKPHAPEPTNDAREESAPDYSFTWTYDLAEDLQEGDYVYMVEGYVYFGDGHYTDIKRVEKVVQVSHDYSDDNVFIDTDGGAWAMTPEERAKRGDIDGGVHLYDRYHNVKRLNCVHEITTATGPVKAPVLKKPDGSYIFLRDGKEVPITHQTGRGWLDTVMTDNSMFQGW